MTILMLLFMFVLLFVMCGRVVMMKKSIPVKIAENMSPELNIKDVANRLSQAIREKTVSYQDLSRVDRKSFCAFMDLLARNYPGIHQMLKRETVNDFSVIYRLKGRKNGFKPVLLIAHYDVVPVEEDTHGLWEYPPFEGVITEGFVWGRGTMDMKFHLIAILEAVEMLLKQGMSPQRDVYLAFGHDEEIRGQQGAAAIAALFEKRRITFDFILDEGGCVIQNGFPLLTKPVALIGIAEKGLASVRITVEEKGGHASMPPKSTSISTLARIIADLEKKPFRMRITPPVRQQLQYIAAEMPFYFKLLIANLWLFAPLVKIMIAKNNAGNAMMRTTAAATMFEGGIAHNILPPRASAVVNFRLLPGETVSDVVSHIRKIACSKEAQVTPMMSDDPSIVSPTDSDGFKRLKNAIHHSFPNVLAAPFLVVGATDASRYENICPNIYRFSPMQIDQKDLDRIHGVNERISFKNIEKAVAFFYDLISEL